MSRLLVIASLLFGCGAPQLAEHPKAEVTDNLPATLEATHPKTGDPRPVHVRVWADTGVRALPHWKEDLTDQLDYAGQLLSPLLGVRLTVDSIKAWDHAGSDPREGLKALEAVDKPDDDTTWIIGYITPGDTAQKAISELGAARLLGRHVVVRAWAEKPETDVLATTLPDLDPGQRAEVLAAHRRHKQAVVLVHVLAQTLGAIDAADPTWIQNPLYSPKQSTISDRNRDLMQLAIDARLGGGTDLQIAHDLLEAIEKDDWGGWIPSSHEEVVKNLRNVLDAAKAGKTAADVPAAAYAQFDRVRELVKRGDASRALAELDNLMAAYPGNATMQEQKCEIMLVRPGVADKTTRAACTRAAELAPGDPTPHLAVGEALAAKRDLAGARAELVQVPERIANLKAAQPDAWQKLVALYTGMNALTWAEEAIAASKLENPAATQEIAQSRARYGMPRHAKFVKLDDEAALVTATRDAVGLIGSGKLAEGERALASARKKWPGAPGLEAMECDLAFRKSDLDRARAACNRALAVDPDESWALYLSGVLALKDTGAAGTRAGIAKLKHAIEVDPELGQAWRALGKAYDRAHDDAAHDALATRYLAKFNQALP